MQINPTNFKKLDFNFLEKKEIETYNYTDSLELLLICIALSEQRQYLDAIVLFEKFKNKIEISNNKTLGLTIIIGICNENSDSILAELYLSELESVEN